MRSPKGSRAATAGLLVVISLVGPPRLAFAHPPDGVLSSPAEGEVAVSARLTVTGSFTHDDPGLASVALRVTPVTGTPGSPILDELGGGGQHEIPFRFSPTVPYNGAYEVQVEGVTRRAESDAHDAAPRTLRRRISVNAPPARPSEVTADVGSDRSVDVSWAKNREPDMIGYQVQRAAEPDRWSPLAEVRQPSNDQRPRFLDESTRGSGGVYRYRVVAVRRGATSDQGVVSDVSEPADAAVPGPPPSTTTLGPAAPTTQGPSTSTSTTAARPVVTAPAAARPNDEAFERSTTVDLSDSFAELQRGSTEPGDPGFDQELPFAPSSVPVAMPTTTVPPSAGAIAAAATDDGELDRRSRVLPVALGLLLFITFMHLRWLLFRLDDADESSSP